MQIAKLTRMMGHIDKGYPTPLLHLVVVVEQCKVLPQCIADWVDGRIAVSSYYV